ncbi:MAG: LysM peptidoglycan-binding domain-containing protein [Anaerolineae bacterium]|nr:LysM peptidoglycan-binding domain-containing protein [Anaerolineae bacterium]
MPEHRTHWVGIIACVSLAFLLAGCFQTIGTNPDAIPAAQSGPTFTPAPTLEPLEVTQVVVVTATTDPNALFQQFQVTPDASGGVIPQSGDFAPVDAAALDPLEITATFIVQGATATSAAYITQTAMAVFGFPTATPTVPPFLATTAPVSSGVDCIHEVRATDRNLYRISLVYGLTVADIARANNIINVDRISIGQQLVIPGCGTTGAVPPATSVPALTPVPASGIPVTSVGGSIAPGSTYTVQQGDTLFEISLRSGIPVMSIANANNIVDIDRIFLNQQLLIPSS